jgi:hypothetical protein
MIFLPTQARTYVVLGDRTVDDNTIEVLETDIPVTPPTKH